MSHKKVDPAWLRTQYLLPPDGLGRSTRDIGKELGLTKERVQQLVVTFGFKQDTSTRIRYFRTRQPSRMIKCPDLDRLAQLYLMPPRGQGRTHDELALEFGVSRPVIDRWVREAGLIESFTNRHSTRMSGCGNPAYVGGNSQKYVRKMLKSAKPDMLCGWCGSKGKLHIHHINHNRDDNTLDNLMWLCYHCNLLEAHIWHLTQNGFLDVEHDQNRIVLTFVKRSNKP